jgi:hypothetical protein
MQNIKKVAYTAHTVHGLQEICSVPENENICLLLSYIFGSHGDDCLPGRSTV